MPAAAATQRSFIDSPFALPKRSGLPAGTQALRGEEEKCPTSIRQRGGGMRLLGNQRDPRLPPLPHPPRDRPEQETGPQNGFAVQEEFPFPAQVLDHVPVDP